MISALAALPRPGETAPEVLERLTAREREVFALKAQGLYNIEIKDRLVLSEATVKTHVSRVLIKTGSRDRAQAVALAYQSGFGGGATCSPPGRGGRNQESPLNLGLLGPGSGVKGTRGTARRAVTGPAGWRVTRVARWWRHGMCLGATDRQWRSHP